MRLIVISVQEDLVHKNVGLATIGIFDDAGVCQQTIKVPKGVLYQDRNLPALKAQQEVKLISVNMLEVLVK